MIADIDAIGGPESYPIAPVVHVHAHLVVSRGQGRGVSHGEAVEVLLRRP